MNPPVHASVNTFFPSTLDNANAATSAAAKQDCLKVTLAPVPHCVTIPNSDVTRLKQIELNINIS